MTAKELFNKMLEENDECTSTEMMIKFAKYHVEAALTEASKIAKWERYVAMDSLDISTIKSSILNAYPLENIC